MKRHVLAYTPLALWAAAVLLVGSLQFTTPTLPSGSDKLAHFIMYGVGGALTALARRVTGQGAGWPGLTFVALTAAADELHQRSVAGRTSDPMDWLADVAGALVFYAFARMLLKREMETG